MIQPNSANLIYDANLTYDLSGFDGLKANVLDMRAPISEGAIMVRSVGIAPEPALRLIINRPTIRITRQDGSGLQIAEPGGTRPALALAAPVGSITLDQQRERGLYAVRPSEGLKVRDPELLRYFLELVEAFSFNAELKQQKAAEQVYYNELLSGFLDETQTLAL